MQRLLNAFTLPYVTCDGRVSPSLYIYIFGHRISGMITARFMLHLRRWEAQHSVTSATNGNKHDPLEFACNQTGNQRSTRSMVDDFGDDPVQRAHQNRNVLSSSAGTVPDHCG